MKKLLIFVFMLCLGYFNSYAAKHALIIAIGDYPASSGWGTISSVNDVPLIKQALLNQGFDEDNIGVLINEQATYENIIARLKSLQSEIAPGDVVVIHYSGHGQQIMDDNAEEIDDKDEALVPYDAWIRYTFKYKGQNHLRDDELGRIITNFRNDLGKNGQLLLLLDSCHSGSATRGGRARGSAAVFAPDGWTPTKNGASKGSDMFENAKIADDAAPFVLISGASANELNYEFEGYGSLSYAFSKAMSELGSDFTYRQLFSKISGIMNVISPNQTPTIEGNVDYKLFKGEYVQQTPYFEVLSIPRSDVVKIQAGKLQGIFKNTTISVLPSGTSQYSEEMVIAKGKVMLAKFNESNILLDSPLPKSNESDYWVFINERTYGDISLKVYLDKSVKTKSIKNELAKFLEENNLGQLVKDSVESEVIITRFGENYDLQATNGGFKITDTENSRGEAPIGVLKKKLFTFAQGQYLKHLELRNPKYEIGFRLLPIEYDLVMEEFGDTLDVSTFTNEAGMFQVRPERDHVVLEITNKSRVPLYFSIIEINTKGEIAQFLPNSNCTLNNNERLLAPNKTMVFYDCVFSFGPPYEKLVLKGFASDKPINFQPTIQTRGKEDVAGTNPLASFLSNTFVQTRSGEGNKANGKIDGYSTEFVYEIIKE